MLFETDFTAGLLDVHIVMRTTVELRPVGACVDWLCAFDYYLCCSSQARVGLGGLVVFCGVGLCRWIGVTLWSVSA